MYECDVIRDCTYATAIISEILGCHDSDTREIFRLCGVHGRGVLEMARVHIDANPDKKWGFDTFIEGVFIAVLNEIEDSVDAAQFESLRDIQLDDVPDEWLREGGGVARNGDAFVNEAEIFADMCRYGVDYDRLQALIAAGKVQE